MKILELVPTARPSCPAGEPPSSVERVFRILRVMSDSFKARLTDTAAAADLNRATASRLLGILMRNNFVVRASQIKQFSLGTEFMVQGKAAFKRNLYQVLWAEALGLTGLTSVKRSVLGRRVEVMA